MKMSFDVEIHDVINWIAQDKNGEWFGYTMKPSPDLNSKDWRVHGRMIQLAHGPEPKDFTNELYKIIR